MKAQIDSLLKVFISPHRQSPSLLSLFIFLAAPHPTPPTTPHCTTLPATPPRLGYRSASLLPSPIPQGANKLGVARRAHMTRTAPLRSAGLPAAQGGR